MAKKKDKRSFLNKLTHKYRMVIYNDITLEEVWHFKLSRMNVLISISFMSLMLTGVVVALIAFTPLKEYIPGFPDGNMQKLIIANSMKVDSLEERLKVSARYYNNIRNIVTGKVDTSDIFALQGSIIPTDTSIRFEDIVFTKSREDTILRQQVAEADLYNLAVRPDEERSNKNAISMYFIAPVKGLITNNFDAAEKHYGVDVVASPNEGVLTVHDGTIVMATWTLETGYVIQVQHENNYMSIYKHNAVLLKKVGDRVKAGETIAIIGNSGELTTGPHLHFELWHNGTPVNPLDYIVF